MKELLSRVVVQSLKFPGSNSITVTQISSIYFLTSNCHAFDKLKVYYSNIEQIILLLIVGGVNELRTRGPVQSLEFAEPSAAVAFLCLCLY